MRDLKFRAWDKVKKEWVMVGFHIIGEVTVFDMLNGYRMQDFNNIEITQFTGRVDNNGMDIYEGDVCILPIDFGPAGTHLYEVQIHWTDDQGWQLRDWMWKEGHRIEVVGNIFEGKFEGMGLSEGKTGSWTGKIGASIE